MIPCIEYLYEALDYNPYTGGLSWRLRPQRHFPDARAWRSWNIRYAGEPAFSTLDKNGYLTGKLDGRTYKAHRIIFKMLWNEEPPLIDHVDGSVSNNLPQNLRSSTNALNLLNKRRYVSNTSGVTGVSLKKATGKWGAHIRIGGKRKHLGYFATIEEASAARARAAKEIGFSERHGVAA